MESCNFKIQYNYIDFKILKNKTKLIPQQSMHKSHPCIRRTPNLEAQIKKK